MDIQTVNPTIASAIPVAPTSAKPVPATEHAENSARNLRDISTETSEKAPRISKIHAELQFDETLNRVVGQIVDEETGEAIHEIPPKELKVLYAKMREQLGPLVDETA